MTNPAGAVAAAPSSTARQTAARSATIGVVFVAAFVASCVALGRCLPFPSVPDLAPRFRHFAERKDEFDTIFIGSSRIRHQIIPQEFDREMAAHGGATHSFNLGYSGMWPPESYYYLRQILALHPRRLRWVMIELMDYRFGQTEGEPTTMRMVYWHDWPHTGMALRLVAESSLPAIEKVNLAATHAWLFVQRLANAGRGAEWLQGYFPSKKNPAANRIERGGFDPEEEGEWSESARADYAQKIRAFEQAPLNGRVRPGFAAALRGIIKDVHRAGAEPIFILPPTVRPEERLPEGLPSDAPIWAFDDPVEYPRLYLPELHYDPGHLNEAGAREFTNLLAQRFANFLQTW